jgi:hypothetical protein
MNMTFYEEEAAHALAPWSGWLHIPALQAVPMVEWTFPVAVASALPVVSSRGDHAMQPVSTQDSRHWNLIRHLNSSCSHPT